MRRGALFAAVHVYASQQRSGRVRRAALRVLMYKRCREQFDGSAPRSCAGYPADAFPAARRYVQFSDTCHTCTSVCASSSAAALLALMRRLSRLSARAAALTRLARKAGSRPASGPLPAGQSRRGPIPHNTAPACGTAPRIAPPAPSAHRGRHTRPGSPDAARRFCRRTGRRTACGKCTPPSLP